MQAMTTSRRTFFVPALWVFTASISSAQNLVNNGGFEDPDILGGCGFVVPRDGLLTGWDVVAGSGIDLVNLECWEPIEGGQSISLDWIDASTISQVIATTVGETYTLSFAFAAEAYGGPLTRHVDVVWNGVVVGSPVFDFTGLGHDNMGWEYYCYEVIGTGSDTLQFASGETANYGPALDDVSLVVSVDELSFHVTPEIAVAG